MTWIKLDDKCPWHPKIDALTDRGFRWWIRGLCYASQFLTDGVLPYVFLRTVPTKVQRELRESALWLTSPDGVVRIHDYLSHQQSKSDIDRERNRNRDRARYTRGSTTGTSTSSTAGTTEKVPRPDTDTDTEEDRSATADRRARHAPGPLAGSLPRDHVDHGFCGARFCVKANHVNELIRRYGAGGSVDVPAWLSTLDASLGPQDSPGGWVWVLQQFDAHLARIGRLKGPGPTPVARRSDVPDVDETRRMLDERERRARS